MDLVQRDFRRRRPRTGSGWPTSLTSRTWSGFAYTALVIDVFSRYIVGWHVSRSLHADLVLTALEQALWAREGPFDGLVHHSDRGVQGEFKESSQHRLVGASLADYRELRRESSIREFCEVGR